MLRDLGNNQFERRNLCNLVNGRNPSIAVIMMMMRISISWWKKCWWWWCTQNKWEGKYPWISCLSGYSRLSPSPDRDRNQDPLVALIVAQNCKIRKWFFEIVILVMLNLVLNDPNNLRNHKVGFRLSSFWSYSYSGSLLKSAPKRWLRQRLRTSWQE